MNHFQFKRFQVEDLARAAMHDGCILAWEQGLGKTVAAIAWPLIKLARRTLLVQPEQLHDQTRETAARFFDLTLESIESIEQIKPMGLHLPPRPNERPRFILTTCQALGHNGADEWPPEIDKHGNVIIPDTVLSRRMAHPLMQHELLIQAAGDRLHGVVRSAEEIASLYVVGVGHEHEKSGIRCIWTPCLARVLARWNSFDCVVVDEGTRLQANDSHIATGVRYLDPKCRLLLTGTPIKNRLESLFWLAHWACGGHEGPTARFPYEGTSAAREEFANHHLQHDRFLTREAELMEEGGKPRRMQKRTARICNVHRLWKLLAPVIVRRRKDECGEDIPPKILRPIHVRPGAEQQKVYAFHLANPPIASKSGELINQRTAIGMQLNILRQAALCPDSHALAEVIVRKGRISGPRSSRNSFNPKQAAILSLVADLIEKGEQVLVGSPFRHFSVTLHNRLVAAGVSSVLLDGNTSPKHRGKLATQFKAKQFSCMVAGIKAMGEGNSFECCSNLIMPSQSWAYDENEQFIHRVWRINSPGPVTIWQMVMENTIDELLLELFHEKGDSAQLALDGRLFEEKVEEVDLAALLAGAVRNFKANAATVDEFSIEEQWNGQLRQRLHVAEMRYREWHPTQTGIIITPGEMAAAIAAQELPSPTQLAVNLQRDYNRRGARPGDWRDVLKNIKNQP